MEPDFPLSSGERNGRMVIVDSRFVIESETIIVWNSCRIIEFLFPFFVLIRFILCEQGTLYRWEIGVQDV